MSRRNANKKQSKGRARRQRRRALGRCLAKLKPRITDKKLPESKWVGGLAEWIIGDTAFLSVAFTWRLPEARDRADWYRALGYKVVAGGPATIEMPRYLSEVAEIRANYPDAVRYHNPAATRATKGCDEKCFFCPVWRTEGPFAYFPEFKVRPVLCDNNLSAIDVRYQEYIIERFKAEGVPLLDANSGFEPKSFDGAVFERWRAINRGPWRFGYDETQERDTVRAVMKMLRKAKVPPKKIRPYVMIGCEPPQMCLQRIHDVIEWGGEPHVQAFIKRFALEKQSHVSHAMGWTAQLLTDMARWSNRRIWRYASFDEYRRSAKTSRPERFDAQQGLFV